MRTAGPDDGPPVVLLHGLATTMRSWDRVVPLLSESLRVVLVDLPGFGESAAAARRGVTIDDMAAAVQEEVGSIDGAVVAGHSMGGLVAVALAERAPALVDRLVLVDAPPSYESRLTARTGQERLLRTPVVGQALWRIAGDKRQRQGLASAFAPGFPVPEVFVEDLAATPWAAFAGGTTAVDSYLAERPLAARLGALPTPATILFGEEDLRVDPASLSGYDGVAGVDVVRLPGVGHTPIWEAPARVAEAIARPT